MPRRRRAGKIGAWRAPRCVTALLAPGLIAQKHRLEIAHFHRNRQGARREAMMSYLEQPLRLGEAPALLSSVQRA